MLGLTLLNGTLDSNVTEMEVSGFRGSEKQRQCGAPHDWHRRIDKCSEKKCSACFSSTGRPKPPATTTRLWPRSWRTVISRRCPLICASKDAPQLERLTRDTSLPFPICLRT